MEGHRMAALALHGLHDADRDWMLEQLPAADRARLGGLLGELAQLGIPKEAGRAQARKAPRAARRAAAPSTPIERVRAAKARDVAAVLAGEPAGLVAACVHLESWPWRPALLARLARGRRSSHAALAPVAAAPVPAPRMRELLVARLDARLEARRTERAHRFGLARLRRWMEARWKTR